MECLIASRTAHNVSLADPASHQAQEGCNTQVAGSGEGGRVVNNTTYPDVLIMTGAQDMGGGWEKSNLAAMPPSGRHRSLSIHVLQSIAEGPVQIEGDIRAHLGLGSVSAA